MAKSRSSEEIFANELQKSKDKRLIELCRTRDRRGKLLEEIKELMDNGADITARNYRALYFATREHNFPLIDLFIDRGALTSPIARSHLAAICDYGDFSAEKEEKFFVMLDRAIENTGMDLEYFIPYINCMFLHGRYTDAVALSDKYGIGVQQIVDVIYPRVIFEMIDSGYMDAINFIEQHRDWIDRSTFISAVSSGETKVVKYILSRKLLPLPMNDIERAVYDGYTDVLDLLLEHGYRFIGNEKLLANACRSFFSNGSKSLEYLLEHGYSLTDSYDGMTVYEHAVRDDNRPLLEYLAAHGIGNATSVSNLSEN